MRYEMPIYKPKEARNERKPEKEVGAYDLLTWRGIRTNMDILSPYIET